MYQGSLLCSIDLLDTCVSLPRSWRWIVELHILFCLRFIEVIHYGVFVLVLAMTWVKQNCVLIYSTAVVAFGKIGFFSYEDYYISGPSLSSGLCSLCYAMHEFPLSGIWNDWHSWILVDQWFGSLSDKVQWFSLCIQDAQIIYMNLGIRCGLLFP